MEIVLKGLSAPEVIARRSQQKTLTKPRSLTKTYQQIFQENIFTLFNLLNFSIAALLFYAGAYANMSFIIIIILNIGIGITQEIKAKKLLDQLAILNTPKAKVLRDGAELLLETNQLVKDDVLILESGEQICSDSIVLDGTAEVNEFLTLTCFS